MILCNRIFEKDIFSIRLLLLYVYTWENDLFPHNCDNCVSSTCFLELLHNFVIYYLNSDVQYKTTNKNLLQKYHVKC